MHNQVILLVVTYYIIAVVSIIAVLNLIEYFNKKKYKNEIQNLDIEKNQIIDAPIMTELSKVEGLTKTKTIKDKYDVWKKEVDDLKKNVESSINDMILDADFLLDQKDYKDYLKNERGTYFKLDDLPFPKIKSEKELINTINNFDEEKYKKEINDFRKKINLYEDGNASKKIANRIKEVINNEKI